MSKKYKCSYCEKRLIRKDLITHIEKTHQELIPQGYTASRLVYNQVNKVDQGKCRVCGKPTTWNEKSGRYNVLCDNPKCKEQMRAEYKKNMLRVRGTYNILNDPEQQKIMLSNRSISGTYKFSDGGTLTYTGSYEKKCLEFMDVVMQIPSKDILSPGPTLEYIYNSQKHFYITDFYYIPYNLIIEVKDGGDNLNTKDSASMKASREKTIEKEHIITDRGEYNYIRLTNNNFAQLIEVFMEIKQKLLEGDDSKTYKINESGMILESYFNESKEDDIKNVLRLSMNPPKYVISYDQEAANNYRLTGDVKYASDIYTYQCMQNHSCLYNISFDIPSFVDLEKIERKVDTYGKGEYYKVLNDMTKANNNGESFYVPIPFKYYELYSDMQNVKYLVYNSVTGILNRNKAKVYQHNFSIDNRKYSVLIITLDNHVKNIYLLGYERNVISSPGRTLYTLIK